MKNNTNRFLAFIVGLYIFIMLRPNFTWGMADMVLLLMQIIPVAIFATRLELKIPGNNIYFLAFFLLFLFICLLRGFNLSYTLLILTFSFIPMVNKQFTVQTADWFRKIFAASMGVSMLVLVLVLVGFPIGGHIILPLNELKDYSYMSYPLLVIPTYADAPRFHGPFDEPGVVGTVGLILLVINKYKLKDFWNVIILISCILSMSFAFFAGTVVYFVVRMITQRNKSVGYALIGLLVFYAVTSQIPIFNELVYSRFEYDSTTGKLAGDNRSSEAQDDFFNSIRGSSIYFWGTNDSNLRDVMIGGAGHKKAIIQNGIVFMLLYCLLFWAFARHYKLTRSQFWIFVVLMLFNLYHRPNLFSFAYIFMYMSYIKIRACENEGLLMEKPSIQ